jgi:putative addiction module killer protein
MGYNRRMDSREREILLVLDKKGRSSFEDWYKKLRDPKARVQIVRLVTRLQNIAFNSYKPVGGGVYELRAHTGPGYRIYFAFDGEKVVLLLAGGDKSSQDDDILKAKKILRGGRGDENEESRRKFAI